MLTRTIGKMKSRGSLPIRDPKYRGCQKLIVHCKKHQDIRSKFSFANQFSNLVELLKEINMERYRSLTMFYRQQQQHRLNYEYFLYLCLFTLVIGSNVDNIKKNSIFYFVVCWSRSRMYKTIWIILYTYLSESLAGISKNVKLWAKTP